jgi:AbrB family looped-hinge helix DNA binding protein
VGVALRRESRTPVQVLDFLGKENHALSMKNTSIISARGRITVPAAVRQRLGLSAGTPVTFELRREGVLLCKGSRGRHPVDEVYGILRLPKSVDAALDEMRGPKPGRR